MKRIAVFGALVVLIAALFTAYRVVDACSDYQDRFKKFIYSEMMKNSPVIWSPEELFGPAPFACDEPSQMLSREDRDRIEREGIAPDEFAEEDPRGIPAHQLISAGAVVGHDGSREALQPALRRGHVAW